MSDLKIKNIVKIVLGALLVAIGVIYALNALELTDIQLSFDGWWTLFIIIPCLNNLVKGGDRLASFFGLILGCVLFLAARDVIDYEIIFKLIVPVIIVALGIKLICRATESKKDTIECDKEGLVAFCTRNLNYSGKEITNVKVGAVFGGVDCNLSNAIIQDGAEIEMFCVFGGVDIIVPDNVNLRVNPLCIFGGISDKRKHVNLDENAITLNINGFCLFGGAEIK